MATLPHRHTQKSANILIDIRQEDLPKFFNLLSNLGEMDRGEARKQFNKYGINRANKNFWEEYDWFQARFDVEQPVRSGLFDLNRYYYEAVADWKRLWRIREKRPLD